MEITAAADAGFFWVLFFFLTVLNDPRRQPGPVGLLALPPLLPTSSGR